MAFTIRVQGLRELQASVRDIDANQVPFVTALALTKTAQDGQKDVKNSLVQKFTIRAKSKMEQGILIKSATKRDLQSTVFDAKPFMGRQETGGYKVNLSGKRFIAVPLRGARPTRSSRIRKSDLPQAVMQSGGFIRENSDGVPILYRAKNYKRAHTFSVVRGPGAVQSMRGKSQVMPMYALVPRWKVDARYGFLATVQDTVNRRFRTNFGAAFAQARVGK